MSFEYQVDPVGLASFVSRARELAEELKAAGPSADGSLSGLTDEAGALADPDIQGLLSGILSSHESDLVQAVSAVESAIDSVERAGSTVCEADGTSYGAFTSLHNGSFDPSRFSTR